MPPKEMRLKVVKTPYVKARKKTGAKIYIAGGVGEGCPFNLIEELVAVFIGLLPR
jgi:hypothetical protein